MKENGFKRSEAAKLSGKWGPPLGVIASFGAGYRVLDDERGFLETVAGGRVLWLDADLRLDIGSERVRVSDTSTNIDGIVGLRGEFDLSDDWFIAGYGDVGAGQSDLTWQVWGSVNYRWDPVVLTAGYRYHAWNFDDDADLLGKLKLHGPLLGAKFRF